MKKKKEISSQEHYKRGKMKPESTHFDVEFFFNRKKYLFVPHLFIK